MYYKFESQEHFNLWHNNLKEQLGYPLNDGITTNYTELLTKDNGELYAFVDEQYSNGLEITTKQDDKPRSQEGY